MLNRKGTTLMETVVSIFILSIVGVIITTGFVTVIRVMGNANMIKNQSDTLLSFAENPSDQTLASKVDSSKKDSFANGYTIKNKFGNTITSSLYVKTLNVIGEDSGKATLRSISSVSLPTPAEKFPEINTNLEGLKTYIDKEIGTSFYHDQSYNDLLKNISFSYQWKKFPSELLPAEMNVPPYYIKIYYPWEYYNGKGVPTDHGGGIIYLDNSKDGYPASDRNYQFTLKIFYDEISNAWYYTERNDYKFDCDTFTNFTKKLPALSFGVKKFNSYDEFMNHVKLSSNQWRRLEMNSAFDSNNPGNSWVSVK